MRKDVKMVVLLLAAVVLLGGCGAPLAGGADEGGEGLRVYVSMYPMYDFAAKIGGDKATVVNLIPSGGEPHAWEPTTADIIKLEQADLFVYNGAGMEHWVAGVLASLQNKELMVVEASEGLTLLEGGHHDHGGDGSDHDHDHDEHAEHEINYDPHVWLDPQNAKRQAERIKDAFVQADAANQAYYEANFDTLAEAFDALDAEFDQALSGLAHKDIVVAHEAYGYLCHAYGLNQIGIEGLSPDSEPDPARMADIIDFAKEHGISTIFFEQQASGKVAESVAAAVGARTDVLSPIEGLNQEQIDAGDDYFSVMRQNLAALTAALE